MRGNQVLRTSHLLSRVATGYRSGINQPNLEFIILDESTNLFLRAIESMNSTKSGIFRLRIDHDRYIVAIGISSVYSYRVSSSVESFSGLGT